MLRGFDDRKLLVCAWAIGCLALPALTAAHEDTNETVAITELALDNPITRSPQDGETTIADIQVKGNRSVSKKKIREQAE